MWCFAASRLHSATGRHESAGVRTEEGGDQKDDQRSGQGWHGENLLHRLPCGDDTENGNYRVFIYAHHHFCSLIIKNWFLRVKKKNPIWGHICSPLAPNSPVSSFILGWEGLKRRNPKGFPLVRWRRNRQDLLQEPEEGGQRAGGEPHRRRAAGMPAQNHAHRSILPIPASSSLHFHPFACQGDDWRSRQGRRWGGEPAGVPAYHEENLPLLTEGRRRNVFPRAMLLMYWLLFSNL